MRRIAATLALALCLAGCGFLSDSVPLITVDVSESSGCILSYGVVDVVADSTFGTVDKANGAPLKWPLGYTARRAGAEVEVLDPAGTVVLKTGSRYRLSPILVNGVGAYDGPIAVCAPAPCPDCKLGQGGPL